MESILGMEHVSYAYHSMLGETLALSDINFDVKEGEFLSIVGPSGCGKSTLLSLLSGLILPEEGSISYYNKMEKSKIGYMLQRDHLLEWRTIYQNVILGLEIQKKLSSHNLEKIDAMLKEYDLYKFKDHKPSALSGGMRQRAALIRTLALEPELLLLDEPFSALDYQTRLTVSDDIGTIIKNEKKTAILVTHDLSEAISLGNRVIVLSKRPGTIKNIIPITFDIETRTALSSRNAKEFKDYFNLLWKE